MSAFVSGLVNPKLAQEREENAKTLRALYAAQAEVLKLRDAKERLEKQVARLEREAREGLACIERLQAALENKR